MIFGNMYAFRTMHCSYCFTLHSEKRTESLFLPSFPPCSSSATDENKPRKMFPFLRQLSFWYQYLLLEASFGHWLVAVPDPVDPHWLQSPWALLTQVNLNDWHLASRFLSTPLQVVEKDKGRFNNWLELTVPSVRRWIFCSLWLLDVWQQQSSLFLFDVSAPVDLLCTS